MYHLLRKFGLVFLVVGVLVWIWEEFRNRKK